MSEAVWVAIIGAQGAVIVALITIGLPLLASTRRHAKSANLQVTNSHETNLRDDLDEKHSDNSGRLGTLETGFETMRSDVGSLKRGVSRIEEHLGIEQTIQPQPRRKK